MDESDRNEACEVGGPLFSRAEVVENHRPSEWGRLLTLPPETPPAVRLVCLQRGRQAHAEEQVSDDQIIGILKEHQAGLSAAELCQKHGLGDATCYKWRSHRADLRHHGQKGERGHRRALGQIGRQTSAGNAPKIEGKPRDEAAQSERARPLEGRGASGRHVTGNPHQSNQSGAQSLADRPITHWMKWWARMRLNQRPLRCQRVAGPVIIEGGFSFIPASVVSCSHPCRLRRGEMGAPPHRHAKGCTTADPG